MGLAAFPDDPSREARYRLNHVYDAVGAAAGDDEDGDLDDGDTDPTGKPNGG